MRSLFGMMGVRSLLEYGVRSLFGMMECDRCFGMMGCDRFWDDGGDRCFGMMGCDRFGDVGVRYYGMDYPYRVKVGTL